jgi:glycosyltransferase involved in cell wall biosynthesis
MRRRKPWPVALGITGLDVGGAERALVYLLAHLDRTAWQPSVTCLQPRGPLAREIAAMDIPVDSLELRSWRALPAATNRWMTQLRHRRPVLLQTMLFHANVLGRLVGAAVGVPVVNGLRVAERRYHWPHVVDQATHRFATRHVAVSQGVARLAHAAGRIPRTRLVVIPNAVDTARFAHQHPWPNQPPYLVVVLGRLDPQKGHADLLAALALLDDAQRQALRVVFVGEGPTRPALEQAIRDNRLTERVRLVGFSPTPETWLAQASLLVLPSRFEGMPNAVLEAMAAGLPVLATAVEGIAELVVPGQTGWVVPLANPPCLAEGLRQFLANSLAAQRMGAAGQQRVADQFTGPAMARRYEAVWHDVLNGRSWVRR